MLFKLLALCARAESHPLSAQRLARLAAAFTNWEAVPAAAARHGLGPLAYAHLRAVATDWPAAARRNLQGQSARERQANAVRFQALGEILRALQAAGIPALVLKGAALAHLVYPEPGLRPMSDLDLLIRPAQVAAAEAQLDQLGFEIGVRRLPTAHHHQLPRRRTLDGLEVPVELHHALLYPRLGLAPIGLDELWPAAQTFNLEGVSAHTLGPLDMLRHLYWHAFQAHVRDNALRLIWVADLVSAVERWGAGLDWPALRRREPALVRLLAQLDELTPWSPAAADCLGPDLRAANRPWNTGWRRGFPPDWRLVLRYQTKGLSGLFQHWTRRN